MHQVPPESTFQGSHTQGSGLLQSRRLGGDLSSGTRASAGRPKKRERNEAVCDSVKQQKTDKNGSSADEREGSQKSEAPSLVGKDGGLCSVASVDRLVCIMTYEWNDSMQRPVDLLVSRTMLAKVVAATVELDCLNRFLKLGGLSVLDRWLQEVYMGRPLTEKEAPAEGNRAVDDLLLALLGALERLPVDLVTLKTCSIGKSVNFLRSHKHPDIQRRARKLVDSWKRRVESEMKQSGDGRGEQSLCPQQMDVGLSASNTHSVSYPAPTEYCGVGRGKYASVASLCSSPESHSKASSTSIPMVCSVDTSSKSPLTPLQPSNESLRPALESTPHPSYGLPQGSEDGRAGSSVCVPGACSNQMRAARNTGGSKNRKTTNLSASNTSSVATALSGSVLVSKDLAEQGLALDRSAHGASLSSAAEVCNLPCCSFFQKNSDNAMVYDHSSRSTLNSASSCVADCKEKDLHLVRHNQQQMCSEPVKTGIQLLASIAASESSTINVKSPDSPSVKSISLQRAITLPLERKIPAEVSMKSHNYQPSRAGGSPQEREHYDRNSSTVSSPSETSTHVEVHTCEDKRVPTVYENISSPADTTSETSLPSTLLSKDAGRKRGASTSTSCKEHGNVQPLCEQSKRPCLQPTSGAEAVGESSIVDKADYKNRANAVFDMSTATNAEGSPPARCNEDGSLEALRQVVADEEQVGLDCEGILSRRGSFERNSSPHGVTVVVGESTGAFTSAGPKQNSTSISPLLNVPFSTMKGGAKNSPLGTHASRADVSVSTLELKQRAQVNDMAASITREESERPVFDLNEMLSGGEEGPVQASGTIFNARRPIQGFLLPASDAMPALPIVPMTPIAVVAATKGPFTLPAISCCRLAAGEPGWKGSAATSAFRPTQPRRSLEKSLFNVPEQCTHGKTILDFDLNVAADSSSFVDEKIPSAEAGVKSSSINVKLAFKQSASEAIAGSVISGKVSEPGRASWDLNQVDEGAAESGTKLDFDLNNGPIVQDNDDVVLAAKHIRMKDPLPSMNTAASNRLPVHPIAPILMPAYAMPNPDVPYPAGSAMPWMNGGPHDGLLQYNIFMQNPSAFASSGMACPPLSSMAAGPYQAIPFGFSSAPMQGFSAPFGGEMLGAPQSASATPPLASTEPLMASQSKPPYIMGVLADVVHQQGMGGFWNRPNLDLNAGPEGVDLSITKDDRRHMFIMNEQMRTRPQVDMAAALQQREQGRVGMPGSMQGAPFKQSAWR